MLLDLGSCTRTIHLQQFSVQKKISELSINRYLAGETKASSIV
jgi:hypothetical protein